MLILFPYNLNIFSTKWLLNISLASLYIRQLYSIPNVLGKLLLVIFYFQIFIFREGKQLQNNCCECFLEIFLTTKIFQKLVASTPTMIMTLPRTPSVVPLMLNKIEVSTTGPFHSTKANAPAAEMSRPHIFACPLMFQHLSFS